jgi:hypothetical protein
MTLADLVKSSWYHWLRSCSIQRWYSTTIEIFNHCRGVRAKKLACLDVSAYVRIQMPQAYSTAP